MTNLADIRRNRRCSAVPLSSHLSNLCRSLFFHLKEPECLSDNARLTESSILPLLLSLLLRANAFDVFIGSLGVQCVCFVCAHQCHCYLGSTSSAPNCRAKTGVVGTDALNPHPIFTLSNRSGKEKERERWRH